MRALAFGLLILFVRPAAALMPQPAPAPDWKAAKGQVYEVTVRVAGAHADMQSRDDREVHRILAQIREQAQQFEDQHRADRDRALKWVREHGLPGEDSGEVSNRIRWIHDVHMQLLYGLFARRAFNEAFSDAARQIGIPGYPLPILLSEQEYCRVYEPAVLEIDRLLGAQNPAFASSGGGSLCEPVVSGRAPDR